MFFPELCAIDIDGTLVGPDRTISEKNKIAIAEYVRSGGRVILASGRMHSSMLRYCLELELPRDNIVLSYNGAMAMTVGDIKLFEKPVPADLASDIVAYCRDNGLHLNFYYDDHLYVRELNKWSKLYLERTGSVPIAIGDLANLSSKAPSKLLIIDEKVILDPLVAVFKQRFGDKLYITKTDDEYLEFMKAGVDKGTGLRSVCEALGIDQRTSAAFGDSYNDVQMIEWAGQGIAMSNGREAARVAADKIVDNSAWTAVGDTLESFVKLRKETKG
jgi:Cof subfamily protein (haloacid dehalogenase superfamily)